MISIVYNAVAVLHQADFECFALIQIKVLISFMTMLVYLGSLGPDVEVTQPQRVFRSEEWLILMPAWMAWLRFPKTFSVTQCVVHFI